MANSPSTESFYIKQLIAGEESAYRYFIRTYEDMAFTLAVSIVKDDFAAQEVAQDAFIKAFNNIKSFNGQSAFKTWFYRIIVNEAFLRLKKDKRHKLVYQEDYETDIADNSHLDNMTESERYEMINQAFKLMPPNEALTLRLYYLEESSVKEMVTITGYTESNIKVLLHRGRKRMLAIIKQQKKSKGMNEFDEHFIELGKAIRKSRLNMPNNGFEQQVIARIQHHTQRKNNMRYIRYSMFCFALFMVSGIAGSYLLPAYVAMLAGFNTGVLKLIFSAGFVFCLLIGVDHYIKYFKAKSLRG